MADQPKAQPNPDLVRDLKRALAMAEAGSLIDGVFVGVSPTTYHRTFSVRRPEDMAAMIGELGMFKIEMELLVMSQRTKQQDVRDSFLRPGH